MAIRQTSSAADFLGDCPYSPETCHQIAKQIEAALAAARTITRSGPGTELKKLLRSLGFAACGRCAAHAAQLDREGPDWCEANMDTIIGWLREEANKRKLPFAELPARLVVQAAIRKARRQG